MNPLPRLIYHMNRLLWRITKPPTVGVRLILVQDKAVLLVKHTYQRQWYLPGGGVKKGETVEEATRREAAEELGAELGILRLVGVYTNFYEHKNDHIVVLSCADFVLKGKTNREIACFAFFPLDDLPNDVSPGTLRRIQEYVGGTDTPALGLW
nr:NUDIX domain-containing protein [Chloroflexota bacterium]